MGKEKPRLGRGLASLLGPVTEPVAEPDSAPSAISPESPVSVAADRPAPPAPLARMLPVGLIDANPFQPRLQTDPQALSELIESVRQHGIVQPIVVRVRDGRYELVAGQRRLEAIRHLNLPTVPAMIRDVSDQQMLEIALIENIHREDLNCVDRAAAYKNYQNTFNLAPEQIAERLGQDRTTVVNYLRLLNLPEPVLTLLRANRLSMGHARALAGLDDPDDQTRLGFKSAQLGLSVRQVENLVARMKSAPGAATRTADKSPNVLDLEQQMTRSLSTKVQIIPARKKGTGKVIIEYYTLDDFDRLLDRICGPDREKF